MKVGDLVRCKVTRADNTLGIVVSIDEDHPDLIGDIAHVMTSKQVFLWSAQRLEVVSESR